MASQELLLMAWGDHRPAGSAGSLQRPASRHSVSTMEYDLSGGPVVDIPASVVTSGASTPRAAPVQRQQGALEAPSAAPVAAPLPAARAAEGAGGTSGASSGGDGSPPLQGGPDSGSSSQSGRSARPHVRTALPLQIASVATAAARRTLEGDMHCR